MCGIFGVTGSTIMADDIKTFRQLAIVNYLRGAHATGMAAVCRSNTRYLKGTSDAISFVEGSKFQRLASRKANTALLGHCRHATAGNADDPDGAHPFQHGHITGMHNGTLFDRSGLSDLRDFEVDSEHIVYSLSQMDDDSEIVDMLEKLDGAYALAWHNRKDNTINIARNDERELAYCITKQGDFIWCSELAMLKAIVSRRSIQCHVDPKLFPIGEWYSIPEGKAVQSDLSNVTITKFEPMESWGNMSRFFRGGKTTYTTPARTNTTSSRVNESGRKVLDAVNLKLDEDVIYSPVEMTLYPHQEDYCMVTAVSAADPYFDVILHGVPVVSPLVQSMSDNTPAEYFKGKAIGVANSEDFDETEPSTARIVCFGMDTF